jgi:hypothetical protein
MIGGFYGALSVQLAYNKGNWSCIDWQSVFLASAFGFLNGALLPYVGGVGGAMALGAVTNTAQTLAGNALQNGDPVPVGGDGYAIAQSMATGALGGLIGGKFAPVPGLNPKVAALLQPNQYARALASQAGYNQVTKNTLGGSTSSAPYPMGFNSNCGGCNP